MLVALAAALVVGVVAVAWAQGTASQSSDQGATWAAGPGGSGLMAKLTPDQQAQVRAKRAELTQQGATRAEIQQAVASMLRGWGIAPPQGNMAGRRQGFMERLAADQRGQLWAKVRELRHQGATSEQIHQAIGDMLKGWGIAPHQRSAGAGAGLMQQLTPAQQELVKAKRADLIQQGATSEQIHQAVADQLKAWGIAPRGMSGVGAGLMAKLTPAQQQQLQAKRAELTQQGATRAQIHQAVADLLRGWGLEPPQPPAGAGAGLMQQLTPAQQAQVRAKRAELTQQGATPAEIHQAVLDMLKGWGLEPPQPPAGAGSGLMAKLTPAQQQQLQAKRAELTQQGATRAQIHQAVADLLRGWGLEPPQPPAGAGAGLMQQLTPAQRELVNAKRAELKQQGATPAEIHQAVRDLLKSWGIELPPPGAAPNAP